MQERFQLIQEAMNEVQTSLWPFKVLQSEIDFQTKLDPREDSGYTAQQLIVDE